MRSNLQQTQQKLKEAGVRSVHFSFKPDKSSLSTIKSKVAYFLETYLKGDCSIAPAANDNK